MGLGKENKEKRKFKRFSLPLRVEVTLLASLGSLYKGITKDVSRQGMRLILHDFNIQRGSNIDLKIYLPSSNKNTLAGGKIIWADINGGRWEVGVEVDKMNKEAKSDILEYAYKAWRQDKEAGNAG